MWMDGWMNCNDNDTIITFPNNNTKSPTMFTATIRKILRAIRKNAHLAAVQKEYPKIAVYVASKRVCDVCMVE